MRGDTAAPAKATFSLAELEAFDPEADRAGAERRFACLACTGRERKGALRSLSLNTETGIWTCYRCGAGGKLTDFWEDRPRLNRKELTKAKLRQAFSITPRPEPEHDPDDAEWRAWFGAGVPLAGTSGEAYLEGRGIPRELADAAGVLYAERWYKRPAVLFPLKDNDGTVTAVGGRFIDDLVGTPKPWRPSENYSKTQVGGRLKYGVFATAGAFDGSTIVIVEGPVDALSLAVCGVPAVALGRTGAPDWLAKRCALRRVLVALDADTAGDEGAEKLSVSLLEYGATPECVRPPLLKDWNDALIEGGSAWLSAWFFQALVGESLNRAAARTGNRPVHAELVEAWDTLDWPAYQRELGRYEREG